MNKKTVKHAVIVLLLIAIAGFAIAGTVSRYSTTGTVNKTGSIANWNVAITSQGENLVTTTKNITFDLVANLNVATGKFAPSSTATAEIELDLTGTEVAVDFAATVDNSNVSSEASYDKLSLTAKLKDKPTEEVPNPTESILTSGGYVLIPLVNNTAFTADNGKKIVTLTLTWDNDDTNNADDTTMGIAAHTLTVPVTFTVRQHLASEENAAFLASASTLPENGTLTVTDNLNLTEYTKVSGASPKYMMNFKDGATINANGKTITTRNFTVSYQGNDLTIENGTFYAKTATETPNPSTEPSGKGSYAIFLWDDQHVSNGITLKNITTEGGINAYKAYDIVLENCDVTSTNYYAVFGNALTSFDIVSGTYRATKYTKALFGYISTEDGESNVVDGFKIHGGTFYTNGRPFCLTGSSYYTPVVYGGSFDCDVSAYCATGYACTFNATTGMYVVSAL